MICVERFQTKIRARRRVLLFGWLGAGCLLLARAAEIQIVEGAEWRTLAGQQHRASAEVSAPRGNVLDRDGVELAITHAVYQVAVAPRELRDLDDTERRLAEALGLSLREVRRSTRADSPWRVLSGRYPVAVREALRSVRGVHVLQELRRFYPQTTLARGILGTVRDGAGLGGIEQAFDEVLRGQPGRQIFARDSHGNAIPGESVMVETPRPGGQVVLSLDRDLQEIAQGALSEAIESTGARGGDLLLTDPNTGDVLAMVSISEGNTSVLSAVNTPYEPGSILKPFTVASLLSLKLASLDDSIDTGEGVLELNGRTLRDVSSRHGVMTLGEALKVSSNVGVALAAQALEASDHYQLLRAFGFGAPTGVGLPGESSGVLRRPVHWTSQSSASLAIGYEISVTPLQMAMAYGALANGGRLMAPRLVLEIRDADGVVVERTEPREVRSVVSAHVAEQIAGVLVDVVEEGTGTRARMASFTLAGKSGTARAMGTDGRYEPGAYQASFAGFFPAEDPQLVIMVRLDRPEGAYFGGTVAAPVTRATLEAILAARETPLNREALARVARANAARNTSTSAQNGGGTFVSLGIGGADIGPVESPPENFGGVFPMPDLEGLSLRAAARRLHALGLRVAVEGSGSQLESVPSAGTRVVRGDTIILRSRSKGRGDD